MSDLLKVLSDGDLAGLELEKARANVDAAKAALDDARAKFEFAKQTFEDVIEKADEAGIPRAKFKKLIEERTAGLWSSGLVASASDDKPRAAKAPRTSRKGKAEVDAHADTELNDDNMIDFETGSAEAFVN